jgi:hypothetical protein
MEVVLDMMHEAKDDTRAEWAQTALALSGRGSVRLSCFSKRFAGHSNTKSTTSQVIKSLDHWPDLGSDLDLYTNADPEDVSKLMVTSFDAQIAPRSWGDRLAGKWNFLIPGLPEAVEIHMGRLGQTGEQVTIASHLAERRGG